MGDAAPRRGRTKSAVPRGAERSGTAPPPCGALGRRAPLPAGGTGPALTATRGPAVRGAFYGAAPPPQPGPAAAAPPAGPARPSRPLLPAAGAGRGSACSALGRGAPRAVAFWPAGGGARPAGPARVLRAHASLRGGRGNTRRAAAVPPGQAARSAVSCPPSRAFHALSRDSRSKWPASPQGSRRRWRAPVCPGCWSGPQGERGRPPRPRPRGPGGTAPQPRPGDTRTHGRARTRSLARRRPCRRYGPPSSGVPRPEGQEGAPLWGRGEETGEAAQGGHSRLPALPPLPGWRRLPLGQPGAATPGRSRPAARSRGGATARGRSAVTGRGRCGAGGSGDTAPAAPPQGPLPAGGLSRGLDWRCLGEQRRRRRAIGQGWREGGGLLGAGRGSGPAKRAGAESGRERGVRRGGASLGLRPGTPHRHRHPRGAGEDSPSGSGRSCPGLAWARGGGFPECAAPCCGARSGPASGSGWRWRS